MKTRTSMVAALAVLALFLICHTSSARAACSSPAGNAAAILYNSTSKVFQYCDDTAWVPMNLQPGSGAGGCSLVPSGLISEGRLIYHEDHRVMTGCAGNVQRPFGPIGGQFRWTQIDSGFGHTCAIKNDGTLWCWGRNAYGQLGDNSTTSRWVQTAISGGGSWKQVSAGREHSCGIKADDTLWCWGLGTNGRLGNGGTGQQQVPVAVNVTGGIPDTWKSVSAGNLHTCAVGMDDTAWCWGNGGTGRRGDGATTATQSTPVAVSVTGSIPDTWKSIAAGANHTCAIGIDDTAWCWGVDTNGQRGDAAAAYSNIPNAVSVAGSIPDTWKKIDTSDEAAFTCAIGIDDTAWCWGYNNTAQLGDNTITQRTSPVAVNVSGAIPDTWKSISAGYKVGCGIASNDSLWCWGGGWPAHGNALGTPTYLPVQIAGGGSWMLITQGAGSGNDGYACAVMASGLVSCWGHGFNLYGEVPPAAASNTPELKDGGSWKALTNNEGVHHCGIKSDDTLWCWGWNYAGQLGDNSTTNRANPVQVNGGGTWKQVSIGWYHTCAIRGDDTMRCWGNNDSGQLGDNTYVQRLVPTAISGGGTWKQVAAGELHTCGIKSDDTLWCWGGDNYGGLGNGAGGSNPVQAQVSGGGSWKSLTSGYLHSCGIQSNDALWCWGYNYYGQLGDNTTTDRQAPTAIAVGETWKQVNAGEDETCGIKSDDTGWCWGANYYAKVGDGSQTQRNVPTAISGGGTWKYIDAGAWYHSCGIKSDDSAYCWGGGGYGQIGAGSFLDYQTTPAQVSGGMTWTSVSAAAWNSCAIATGSGSLWCWGLINDSGHPMLPQEMKDDRCANPAGSAGKLIYNSSSNLMQYCDGVSWVRINK